MYAIMKDGTREQIDTKHLFNDQYNTIGTDRRIFDRDIAAIVDDVRAGLGKCKYCGTLVKAGEEEKHYQEREENRNCKKCFWNSKKEIRTIEEETENSKIIRVTYEDFCRYPETSGHRTKCTCTECRAYGIEWFTPENTFFLKYPNGIPKEPIPEELKNLDRWDFWKGINTADYTLKKKIGSYILTALTLPATKEAPETLQFWRIANCRKDYNFIYINGELYTNKYAFTWKHVKTLDGIPEKVMEQVNQICNKQK